MTRGANAYYLRRGVWIVGPLSQTESGIWIATSPYVQLPKSATYTDIAAQVRVALSQSKQVPDVNFRDPDAPRPLDVILAAAGLRSWGTFIRGAKSLSVWEENVVLTLSPSVNEGAREGFNPIEDAELRIPATATSERLGEAIRQAFSLCE